MNLLENQRAADIPTGIYQDLEEQLMQNIIRHCRDYGQPIATDDWLLKKMAEIGKLNQENIRIISHSAGLSQTAVERMLNAAAEEAIADIEPGMKQLAQRGLVGEVVPAAQSKNVKQVVKTLRSQAKDTQNLCNTTMLYKARDAYQRLVQNIAFEAAEIAGKQAFLDILNKNVTAAVIGAESRQQVLRKCIREFNDKGIPAFVDKRGREWTPEAYVNMAMRTTSKAVSTEVQFTRADDYGIDLVEVSSHSGARPKCARDQGKIFDRANKSDKYPHWRTSSYGKPDGLLGINCRHHIFPYIEGVSIRRFFPTEDMDANNKLYKETQIQRALERDVRKQKRECMLFNELGDEEAFEESAVKLKAKEAKLKAYVDGNSQLHRRRDREQVVGFDKTISSKAVAANKNRINLEKGIVQKEKDVTIKEQIAKESLDVRNVGKIDKKIYNCVTADIVTDEVIITDERIGHIKERHPNDYERYCEYLKEIVEDPDYIIETTKPNTALILKEIRESEEKQFKTVLRLVTSTDNAEFKNSIITFMKINDKEWKRLLKNKKILYKKE